jgi:hypothetical protein
VTTALGEQLLDHALERRDVLLELGDLASLIADLPVALSELLAQLLVFEIDVYRRHASDNADALDSFHED